MPSNGVTATSTVVALALGAVLGAAVAADEKPPVLEIAKDAEVAKAAPTKSEVKRNTEKCTPLAAPVDNDWDGVANELFPSLGQPCDGADEDTAACGAFVCNAAGTGVECSESEVPRVEWCDGIDNDCDGQTDEGFKVGDACSVATDGGCRRAGLVTCDVDTPTQSVCSVEADAGCE